MAPLLEKVTAGVVSINTVEAQATDGTTIGGIGSGVILNAEKGLVITNHHVIEDADGITVILGDRREYKAEVLGEDPDTDLALLKIEAENLSALPLAEDDMLRVGDYVIAVGNPFGLSSTVTSGIVSAIGREGDTISSYTDYIQTDASINPGNSGGALVNSGGDLVGINASLLSRSGSSSGIGFAIPLYIVRYVADQLEIFGSVDRGTMGVMITPVPHRRSEELKLTTLEGALIADIIEGGPAEAIGLQVDDVITHFAGRTIKDSSDLRYAVGLVRPGTSSDVQFLRAGEPYIQNITIGHKTFSRPVSYQVILESDTQDVVDPES
jgi:S1-C subfamily serine protease